MKVQWKYQLRSDTLPERKTFLQGIVYTLSQQLHMICSQLVDYMGPGPRSESRSGLFTITFKNPLGEFCVSHPHKSDLCVSRGPGSKEGILPAEDTSRVTLNFKLWLLPGHFGVTILSGFNRN